MSFLKITAPAKRDLIVKEYLETKKNIRDNLLSERKQLQTNLSKFFRPITETQKATGKEVVEELKPIKEGLESLPQFSRFPTFRSITDYDKETDEETQFIGSIAEKYVRNFAIKSEADTTYGIYDRKSNFYIDNKQVLIIDNNIIY